MSLLIQPAAFQGDRAAASVLYLHFQSAAANGTPTTLSGAPAVSVYKDDDTTESVAGLALTADFDGRTGLNVVKVDTGADAFYAAGHDYEVVITTGTVSAVSVVGVPVGHFSLAKCTSTLSDGVAHGGPPGSSTATLALDRLSLTSAAGTPLTIVANGASQAAFFFSGGPGDWNQSTLGYFVGQLNWSSNNTNCISFTPGALRGVYLFNATAGAPTSADFSGSVGTDLASSGTFTVSVVDAGGVQTTAPLAYNVSASALHDAIAALSNVASLAPVTGSGTWADPYLLSGTVATPPIANFLVDATNIVGSYPPYAPVAFQADGTPGTTSALIDMSAVCYGALRDQSAATSTTVNLTGLVNLPATVNALVGSRIRVLPGSGFGQERTVTAWDGTAIATVDRAWVTQPVAGDIAIALLANAVGGGGGGGSPWDEVRGSHTTPGTFGEYVSADAILFGGNAPAQTAGKLWVLDDSGGGVAPASTALSTVTWTGSLATSLTTLAGHDPGSTLASQTNITGGTITTVTNLTNAPTVGDFTAAMKASLNAATPAVTVSDKTGFSLTSAYDFAKGTVAMTESYAALGVPPTPAQALFEVVSLLSSRSVAGTTLTSYKLDGVTAAMTFVLNSSSHPTSQLRSS